MLIMVAFNLHVPEQSQGPSTLHFSSLIWLTTILQYDECITIINVFSYTCARAVDSDKV